MSLPTFTEAMQGFTTSGLTAVEALKRRAVEWNWKVGAELIGPYLDGNDLVICCLVSKDFKKYFMAILWSKPLRILEAYKRPYMNKSIFMGRSRSASPEARSFVREFDLNRFYCAIMNDQASDVHDDTWLVTQPMLFPNLQFTILPQAPNNYDTGTELHLVEPPFHFMESETASEDANESLSSRVTTVARERDALTSESQLVLFSAYGYQQYRRLQIIHRINTSHLMYLDLSYTKRDFSSLHILPVLDGGYPNLRVLKLRGLHMVDAEFARLTQIHGCRLWSLDVRDNMLSDSTIGRLAGDRFMLDLLQAPTALHTLHDQDLFEDVPEYQRIEGQSAGRTTNPPLRPDESHTFAKYIEAHSTFPPNYHQALDNSDPLLSFTGLTHLYISGNRVTSKGVLFLLGHAKRLQVLDTGYAESSSETLPRMVTNTKVGFQGIDSVPHLLRESGTRMEVLRIQHGIVTNTPTVTHARNHRFTLSMLRIAESYGESSTSEAKQKQPCRAFSPLNNHRIRKLTLTGIPTKSYGWILNRLIDFLEDCRIQEERLSGARKHASRSRRAPQLLPGLRALHLEFLAEDASPPSSAALGSVSGDRDAANFHASSEADFSFFQDRSTMSSVSRRGSVATFPGSAGPETVRRSNPATSASRKGSFMDGGGGSGGTLSRAVSSSPSRPGSSSSRGAPGEARPPSPSPPPPPVYVGEEVKDVVQELKKYRAQQAQNEGRWTGELKLVFPNGR